MYPTYVLDQRVPSFSPQSPVVQVQVPLNYDYSAKGPETLNETFTVFIGCLHGKTTEALVEHYFSQFGPVYDVTLKRKG
jgi:RNA recognition motif-containing protein